MPLLPQFIPAGSANLPTTKDVFEEILPNLEGPTEVEPLERASSAVPSEPKDQAGTVAGGTSEVLAEMEKGASRIRELQSQRAKVEECASTRFDCKTNRVEGGLH